MIKIIRSNEFVEMFVKVLLKGKSGKVAVLTDDNKLKWKPSSILTQFLNPSNDRTYMTIRIAETLQRTTKLLLESDESSGEMFNRIILLIYSITGVDLTFLYDDSIDDRNKMLLNVMKIIIDSFCNQDQVEQHLLFERVYGLSDNIEIKMKEIYPDTIAEMSYITALNLMYRRSESKRIKNYPEIMIVNDDSQKTDKPHPIPDSSKILKAYINNKKERANRLQDFIGKIPEFITKLIDSKDYEGFKKSCADLQSDIVEVSALLKEIQSVSGFEEFKTKYCQVHKQGSQCIIHSLISEDDLNDTKGWKSVVFQWLHGFLFGYKDRTISSKKRHYPKLKLRKSIAHTYNRHRTISLDVPRIPDYFSPLPHMMLYNPRMYIILYRAFFNTYNGLLNNENISRTETDQKIFSSNCYRKYKAYIKDCLGFMELQLRMRLEIGTFGCFQNQFEKVIHKPESVREFIKAIIKILLGGVSNKVGKEVSTEKYGLKYRIIRSDLIAKYLKEKLPFSATMRDGLYLRIVYYLYPEKQYDSQDSRVTPKLFMELLWQLFYTAFHIDFYMLRPEMEESRKSYERKDPIPRWQEMILTLLTAAIEHEDMSTLRTIAERYYYSFEIEMDGKDFRRFPAEDLTYCCEQEALIASIPTREYKIAFTVFNDPQEAELVYNVVYQIQYTRLNNFISSIQRAVELLKEVISASNKHECVKLIINPNNPSTKPREIIIPDSDTWLIRPVNWKEAVYMCTVDPGLHDEQNRVLLDGKWIVPIEELLNLFKNDVCMLYECFSSLFSNSGFNIFSSPQKEHILSLKNSLWEILVQLSRLNIDLYNELYELSKVHTADKEELNRQTELLRTNIELMHSESVKVLYQTVRRAYLFILYQQWIDKRLKIVMN